MRSNILFAGSVLLIGGDAAAPPPGLYGRAACNRDNLFRCFIDERYSVQASDYCSGLSPSTVTVATITETITSTMNNEITVEAVVSTVTATTTVFTETIPTATTTLTLGAGETVPLVKRDTIASPPKCMTNGVSYPASRITSACSCIDVPASTVSVTYTAGTETVSTGYTTPSITLTNWETVYTATTGGTFTATVGPPVGAERIVNGDFETGDIEGWELSPETWAAQMSTWNSAPISGNWSLLVLGSEGSLGKLRHVLPVYMEAGQYQFEVLHSPQLFPLTTCGWGQSAVLDVKNQATGTTITVPQGLGNRVIIGKQFVCRVSSVLTIPEEGAGPSEISIRYLAIPPSSGTAKIDGISLKKI
ncbi:hypothetical protein jhhlp_003049 [Lomentospora prolificans]|uniref:Uncharacterized protein n=1 Tax=Lomentospora prolificans TaxID=41688 RepID=A0A2N3NFW3_9PEZI|nr:hypothetical protein jhhlp_003049 [Lomentospora prolificans]